MARWAGGADKLRARGQVRPADLDRARDRRAPERCCRPPGAAGARPHLGDLRPPEVADPAKRFAGNNLACGNCHLQAGTKKFGIPLFGLFGKFPHYNARLGAEITIEERLNACMTRSMNGRPLPAGAPEMQALVAYIKFLSTGVAPAGNGRPFMLRVMQALSRSSMVISAPKRAL